MNSDAEAYFFRIYQKRKYLIVNIFHNITVLTVFLIK